MLKTIVISLWACGVTAGTLFFALSNSTDHSRIETKMPIVELDPTFSEPLVVFVPVVSMSKVTGYLFTNMSVLADTKILEDTTIPLNMLIQDSYLAFLAGNKDFALPDISVFDYQKLKDGVKSQINQTAGRNLVEAIYMSDLNFVKAKEARKGNDLKSLQSHMQESEEAKPEVPKAKSKH